MKQLILVLSGFFYFTFSFSNEIVIENPPFNVRNHNCAEIEKIVLSDTATILYFKAYSDPKLWIKFASDTYIQANGKKYLVRHADGIKLDTEIFAKTGVTPFSLNFPPIDPQTSQIDFIEGDCSNCFKTWGIELKSDTIDKRIHLPEEITKRRANRKDTTPLQTPAITPGDALIKGQIIGYIPDIRTGARVYTNNPLTGEHQEHEIAINNEGIFECSIPVVCTTQVILCIEGIFYDIILISPQEETMLYLDLQLKYMQEGRCRKDKKEPQRWIFFGGANADYNEQYHETISDFSRQQMNHDKIMNDVAEMTFAQYKSYILEQLKQNLTGLKALDISTQVRELTAIDLQFRTAYYINFGHRFLINAYNKKHHIQSDDETPLHLQEKLNVSYFDYLKDLPINDKRALQSFHFMGAINEIGLIRYRLNNNSEQGQQSASRIQELTKLKKLPAEDLAVARDIIRQIQEDGNKDSLQRDESATKLFYEKYKADLTFITIKENKSQSSKILEEILGTNKGIAFDLISLQGYSYGLQTFTPLTYELKFIEQMGNPLYTNYLTNRNNQLLAQIEANKNKKGYNVYETPDSENDQILHDILKPFEGKVVLIDFWATWCGPCRSAMKEFEPVKQAYKDKGVVFLYLTDESSPLGTWKNMIPDIQGEHYRIKTKQFQYLRKKFGALGIPSYLILNKKGEQVYFRVGFEGADVISRKIDKELEL